MLHEGNKVIDESRQGEPLIMNLPLKASKKLFIESYGCAMNFSDSEIVASVLNEAGYETTNSTDDADLILLNSCAIRDNAELRIWQRLKDFKKAKKKNPNLIVGLLGCMAERLKTKVLEQEKLVDLVAGPDAYRDLPQLVSRVESGHRAINVLLSREETYAEINPVRLVTNGVSAFISIMRGCDNMCSFCVVPFTRGRERSRDPESILNEAKELFENGYREVTLLGQNVDSYLWWGGGQKKDLPSGVAVSALNHLLPEEEQKNFVTFANLLEMVAAVHPDLRIRFSTSNPRDLTDAVIDAIAQHENICNYIHLPVQSGSTSMLARMNRGYSREQYLERIQSINQKIPGCGLSTDIITGFCGETDEEHADTISLMKTSAFEYAYMFKYSERPGTAAAKNFKDDIAEEIKSKRLSEIVALQSQLSHESNLKDLGKTFRVLIDGFSKKSKDKMSGRNSQNKVIVFAAQNFKPGDYVHVHVTSCTSATLIGELTNAPSQN